MPNIVAVDIGGTFTDFVSYDTQTGQLKATKSPTTYSDFVEGVTDCFSKAEISPADAATINHGTTLVINSLLQRRGAKTALVTTAGFRDVLEIARGNRPDPFDLHYQRDEPLIPRELRFEVDERVDSKGQVLRPLRDEDILAIAERLVREKVDAVAVFLLNSYAYPDHERQLAARLHERLPSVFVTCSVSLSRERYEYERCSTVCANAFVGPQVDDYLSRLNTSLTTRGFSGSLVVMGSNGGVISVNEARRRPIALVESGPVGGCIGASAFATALGLSNMIAFDMGGTTAKCAPIANGRFTNQKIYYVGGYVRGFPVRSSVIDINEVGAGGGSIARVDGFGRLSVGPESAGSTPGPACYGRGGLEPTVTDANLVLGRLNASRFIGGELTLDRAKAEHALRRVCEPLGYAGPEGLATAAEGILTISNAIMADAVRRVSIERGLDPRDFTLFAFGGGGPLHASALARELAIPTIIIPPEPGNFSALGMLLSDARLDRSQTFVRRVESGPLNDVDHAFESMEAAARQELNADFGAGEVLFQRRVEMRFAGQRHEIEIDAGGLTEAPALKARFLQDYERRYGHVSEDARVETQSLHLVAIARASKPRLQDMRGVAEPSSRQSRRRVFFGPNQGWADAEIHSRAALGVGFEGEGPALIEEYGSTTLLYPGDRFTIGSFGEIRIRCSHAS